MMAYVIYILLDPRFAETSIAPLEQTVLVKERESYVRPVHNYSIS
jgi:hypothetical protein